MTTLIKTCRMLSPKSAAPAGPLFVVLHDVLNSAERRSLEFLEAELLKHFPAARLAVLDSGPLPLRANGAEGGAVESASLSDPAALDPYVSAVRQELTVLQRQLQAETAATALIGIGHAAAIALELAKDPEVPAGRIAAFGGQFMALPQLALEPKLTVHILHAQHDPRVSAQEAHKAFLALSNLQSDATIDIAHHDESFSEPLIKQLMQRFQTYVPQWMCREIDQLDPQTLEALREVQEHRGH